MKLGILTQPLIANYGGILQAYALQRTLKSFGHDAIMIQRHDFIPIDVKIKRIILFLMGKGKHIFGLRSGDIAGLSPTSSFIRNEIIPKTKVVYSTKALDRLCKKMSLEGYVVGSDQVWRPQYTPCIYDYFLEFVKDKTRIKRIAYAASFGVDEWEFSDEQTVICADLAKLFDSVSVREMSACKLCKDYLHVEAELVLDPTLLLDRADYIKLASTVSNATSNHDEMLTYILDSADWKEQYASKLSLSLKKERFAAGKDQTVYEWLSAFQNCSCVFTDSFHGVVFSILFNKPFWVVINKERGRTRVDSLLTIFDLKSRIIENDTDLDSIGDIDWDSVNRKREEMKVLSLDFLKKALK